VDGYLGRFLASFGLSCDGPSYIEVWAIADPQKGEIHLTFDACWVCLSTEDIFGMEKIAEW
jgi:hypothetical protein